MPQFRKIHAAVLAAAVASAAATSPASAQLLPEAPTQALTTFICTPKQVGEFSNRIHVLCTTAASGISYFAVATSNANRAAHALSLFSIALASGRDLLIYYDAANTSGTAFGCLASNCRAADGVELL